MHSFARPSLTLGAIAVAVGLAAGASYLISAHRGLFGVLEICRAIGWNDTNESGFLAENGAAMTKMMNAMAVKPTGDVDADFVATMTPHHQGAIEMAIAVLRYGHNAQIRRLAQEIIVTQQEEIAALQLAVGDPIPPSVPSPTQLLARLATDAR
jgi:hypothetical protein